MQRYKLMALGALIATIMLLGVYIFADYNYERFILSTGPLKLNFPHFFRGD
jgi:hypothetical protein